MLWVLAIIGSDYGRSMVSGASDGPFELTWTGFCREIRAIGAIKVALQG